jgi:hypothetical protein
MVPKSIKEAMNRGSNLLMVGFLGVLGVGVFAEIINEPDLIDKADDILVALLALAAVIWYFRSDDRYRYSWLPFSLVALALAIKVGSIFAEIDNAASVGDEFGIVPSLLGLLIVSLVIMIRSRRTLKELDERQVNC